MKSDSFHPPSSLNTAVLFLVFNRLDTTRRVFETIREARPPRLYIAADGARVGKGDETKIVQSVRDYVMSNIDWSCEVKTLFRDKNLGCKYAVSSGINWFFENEDMGIILEDDCLPCQSFFWFCEKTLRKYKNNHEVMMIAGTSFLFNEIKADSDYFFSNYYSIWGWATWKNAWSKYDVKMKSWPENKANNYFNDLFSWDAQAREYFLGIFEMTYQNKIDTWAYQWVYTCLIQKGYCLTPYKNLISNIGLVGVRTHTASPLMNMERRGIRSINNLISPPKIKHDINIDIILFNNIFRRFKRRKKIYIRSIIANLINNIKNYFFQKEKNGFS